MRRRLSFLLLVTLFSVTSTVGIASTEDDDGIWIDVRSPQEYRQGHIEGAINIPHSDIGHRIFEFVDDPALPVHLYDANGVFAGLALEILMEMGFEYVINEGPYEQLLARLED